MGTHDINVHIYPYLKIKMDKKNGHKIYTKAQNACSKENNFSFSTSTKFLPFTEFSSTERNKKPFSRRETKKKKKRKRQNLDGTGTRPVRIFMERPCQRRSTIEKFNPQKLNEDPNNGRGPFLLPRNLADSFITRVSTKRVHVNGTGVIKRGGG